MNLDVEIKILDPRLGQEFPLPSYGTPHSAGLDLRAMIDETLVLAPNEVKLVSTGMSLFLADSNYVGLIKPRSGLGHKKGLVLGNLEGVIDADYQGPLMMSLWNRSPQSITIEPGEAVAQFVVVPMVQLNLNVVKEFSSSTIRGEGGFGSTSRKP